MSHFLCRKVVPHSRISLGSSARQHPAACVLFEAGNRPVCGDWTATVAKTNTIRYLKSQIKVTHHSCWFCRVLVQYLEPEAVLLRVNPTSHLRSIRPWTRLWCGGSHRRSVAIRLKCKFIQEEDTFFPVLLVFELPAALTMKVLHIFMCSKSVLAFLN